LERLSDGNNAPRRHVGAEGKKMGGGDITGASRPSRRLIFASLAIWLILALALPLSALTLNVVRLAGTPLGFWVAAQGALIGLVLLAVWYAWRAGGAKTGEGVKPGLVFAGEAIGAFAILGYTGAIAELGYDGLALPLGLVAGLALLAILVAPRFVLYPAQSISGFFAIRYGGAWVRRLALLITLAAAVLLLGADLKAGAFAVQSFARIEFSVAVVVLSLAVAAVWLVGSIFGMKKLSGFGFALILAGLLTTLVAIAARSNGWTIPYLTIGAALENHRNLSINLVVNGLANVESQTPMTSPFLQLTMRNFAGLLLAIALGIVAAPHLLGRHISQAAVAPGGAIRRTVLALTGVAVIAASLAPLAVYSRIGFEQALSKGIEIAVIPQSFADASALGWVKVCDSNSDKVGDLTAACAKATEQRGFLRLQDLAFTSDGFVVAAPKLAGLDPALEYPLLLAIVLAALLAGNALIAGIVAADTEVRLHAIAKHERIDFRAVALGAGVVAVAGIVAAVDTTGTGFLAADGFALLAAGIFPILALGLHWRHMNAAGAIAAMLVGTAIVAAYILGVQFWPVEFVRLSSSLSNADPETLQRFADLGAAVGAAPDPQALAAATADLKAQAIEIANWGGLKPAAIVLVAVPAAFVVSILFSLLAKDPSKERPAP
jgi:putative solute:sodium symporter small subunit